MICNYTESKDFLFVKILTSYGYGKMEKAALYPLSFLVEFF